MFTKYDSISIDYEGDEKYLDIEELIEILGWIQSKAKSRKNLFYTIAMRSNYDILKKEHTNTYIQDLLAIYHKYENFQVILVAGNKKYVDKVNQKLRLSERFHTWIQALQKNDSNKTIYLGADNILTLTKSLLQTYETTKAILLKNPMLASQMAFFDLYLQHRLGIYSLAIDSIEKAVNHDYVKGYLQRRGIEEINYKEKIKEYSILQTNLQTEEIKENYNFMFLFAVSEFI